MEEFIQSVSTKLNLPVEAVRQGIGIVLNFLQTRASGTELEEILAAVPGARELAEAAAAKAGDGPAANPLSGLLAKAGGLLGQDAAAATEALAALQKAGIPLDKAAPLAAEFVTQARTVVGTETVDAILARVPALQALLK